MPSYVIHPIMLGLILFSENVLKLRIPARYCGCLSVNWMGGV